MSLFVPTPSVEELNKSNGRPSLSMSLNYIMSRVTSLNICPLGVVSDGGQVEEDWWIVEHARQVR